MVSVDCQPDRPWNHLGDTSPDTPVRGTRARDKLWPYLWTIILMGLPLVGGPLQRRGEAQFHELGSGPHRKEEVS